MLGTRPPLFVSALIPHALRCVRERGGDDQALVRKFKLSTHDGEPSVLLPTEMLSAFMEAAAEESSDPLFGLHCAATMPRGAYQLFEFSLRSAPDITMEGPHNTPLAHLWEIQYSGVVNAVFDALSA